LEESRIGSHKTTKYDEDGLAGSNLNVANLARVEIQELRELILSK
jgi:hypothetical protein